jgi:hypothetical protein
MLILFMGCRLTAHTDTFIQYLLAQYGCVVLVEETALYALLWSKQIFKLPSAENFAFLQGIKGRVTN